MIASHIAPRRILVLALALAVAACAAEPVGPAGTQRLVAVPLPDALGEMPAATAKTRGRDNFAAGDFGMALRYYEAAAKSAPNDAEVWLGYAASADRTGHFELSGPAYEKVKALAGPGVEYYNNLGYSLMLQGRFGDAARAYRAALKIDPSNATVKNNMIILNHLRGTSLPGRLG